MNDQFNNAPSDVRASIVYPKQKDYNVIAISNPAILSNKEDKQYEKLISGHIDFLNKQESVLARDKKSLASEMLANMEKRKAVEYNGERVDRLFHSMNFSRMQQSIDRFETFQHQGGNYFVTDIETFGDSQERKGAYGISEIAISEYDEKGQLVDKTYNAIVKQDKGTVDALQKIINEIKADKYTFNKLEGWAQRSIVDLMRYSSYADKDDKQAFMYDKKSGTIKHHSIIKSVFDDKDQLDSQKVIRNIDDYLKYMQSGLDYMKSNGLEGKEAIQEVANIMGKNSDKFFLTFNGNNFDMPVLQAFAKKNGITMPSDANHLDYLNVIKTAYMDSDDLKKTIDPNYNGGPFNKDKLAAFVHAFIEDNNQDEAHNAQVDIDNTSKVVALTRNPIQDHINNSETKIRDGFNYHPTEMSWNEGQLTDGQQLFASGGVQAFREGDESFKTKLDENGKWVPETSGFNKTVINSKTFYQFAGHQVLEDGKQAFTFFNPDAKEYSYIVRQGENAFAELQDFVQSRFYNWDNLENNMKREISHAAESDRARRRYDRYFSMDGGGKGLALIDNQITEKGTMGFSGLKRMLGNAQIMQDHLESNGDVYREAVEQYKSDGLSANQAKKKARKVRSHELLDKMDFNSQWDDNKKEYVMNTKEKDHFFKMYKRLIDELPYLQDAVSSIDAQYADEIAQAGKERDHYKRNEKLRSINQKRDQAIVRYQQSITEAVGVPTQETELKLFENQRLSWMDGELNDTRSINFETAGTARDNIYNYAKSGIDDVPNKQRLMKERMFNLISNLQSQGKIDQNQYKNYAQLIHDNDRVWNSASEIAIDMRTKSARHFESKRVEPTLLGNDNIKTLDDVLEKKNLSHANLIQKAIQDTSNAEMLMDMDAIKGKKLVLSEQMKNTLDILDEQRFSGLNPNNYQALENLVDSIRKSSSGKNKHIAMAMDAEKNMKVFVYDGKDSITVQNQLQKGSSPSKALEINMPLINESGTHKIGGQVLNAHSFAVLDGKEVNLISSSEYIADGYAKRMKSILRKFDQGDVEGANLSAKRTLREQVKNMSGIQRNMVGGNDGYEWSNNESDLDKQSHIKVSNAMIEDIYYNYGDKGYKGITLTRDDFFDPDDAFRNVNGQDMLRPGLTFDDIQMDKSYAMLSKMTSWADEKLDHLGVKVSSSSLKAEQFSKGTVAMTDVRETMPYGSFYNHGRDNAVQYKNVYNINEETNERIKGIKGISRNPLLKTERQMQYEAGRENNASMNVKTAYMTQDELTKNLNKMLNTEDGRQLLNEVGLIRPDGTLDPIKTPRLYEQQGILADDLAEALEVDNEKRFEKGNQFTIKNGLQLGSEVKPGDELGTRTYDNGTQEVIRYEGTKTAKIISGAQGTEDLVVQWKSKPFKFMLDGEKMTDTVASRKLITALTGRDDVGVIINPDVAKHRDFGMLMSGEARLMADEINKLKPKKKKTAIDIIEGGEIGLKWNEEMNGFVDHSMDKEINKNQFNKVFEELQNKHIDISPVTSTGVRIGILDMRMSKVSNYSKIVDSSGKRVIDYQETFNEETGQYDVRKTYGANDGVQWGHREMGVLRSNGMDKTYEHVYDIMKEKTKRLNEVEGLTKSLQFMTEEHAGIQALSARDFETLPENYRNKETYKGTIFDSKNSLIEKFSGNAAVNDHGFWFELPSVERGDGHLSQVKINLGDGGEKTIDKIFVPFTAAEGANGDIHLRDLQKKISNIYKRAEEVNNAGSIEEARAAQKGLQGAVNGYVSQSFKELTSSKGMLFEDVYKTTMGGSTNGVKTSSASGLFKLMDFETSQRYGEGQFTVISENMAKKMGVYDQLRNGDELFTANVRYPTFHDGAMQFGQLKMDASIKDGEIHTTSFASMLQNADSDGDYSHITVIDDKDIQQEWKQAHDTVEQRFQEQYEKHVQKESGSSKLSHNLVNANASDSIEKQLGNSDEQAAAKIGKMTIGRASNLNLFIRQVADYNYDMDSTMNTKMKAFGSALEQKLIDAKHGAKPAGLNMIDAIYAGDWDRAMEIDESDFKGMFQKDYFMNDVAKEMPMALQGTANGLRTSGLKFGTSTGIQYNVNSNRGISDLMALLNGEADPKEFGGHNKALEMHHKHLREQGQNLPIDETTSSTPIEGNKTSTMRRVSEERHSLQTRASNAFDNGVSSIKGSVSKTWDSIKGMSGKKQMLLGGGIAVGALTGYNILNTEKPVMPYNNEEPPTETIPETNTNPAPPRPAISMPQGEHYATQQNASIRIQASGASVDSEQITHAVSEGMTSSGMNAGPTRMSVNYQDNTQQLNRQWYRDKVRENI